MCGKAIDFSIIIYIDIYKNLTEINDRANKQRNADHKTFVSIKICVVYIKYFFSSSFHLLIMNYIYI